MGQGPHLFRVVALGDQRQARHLAKLRGVAKHADVHELHEVSFRVLVHVLAQCCSDVCRLLLDDGPLLGCCLCPPDLGDERAACETGTAFDSSDKRLAGQEAPLHEQQGCSRNKGRAATDQVETLIPYSHCVTNCRLDGGCLDTSRRGIPDRASCQGRVQQYTIKHAMSTPQLHRAALAHQLVRHRDTPLSNAGDAGTGSAQHRGHCDAAIKTNQVALSSPNVHLASTRSQTASDVTR